jgi:hypothetical protein
MAVLHPPGCVGRASRRTDRSEASPRVAVQREISRAHPGGRACGLCIEKVVTTLPSCRAARSSPVCFGERCCISDEDARGTRSQRRAQRRVVSPACRGMDACDPQSRATARRAAAAGTAGWRAQQEAARGRAASDSKRWRSQRASFGRVRISLLEGAHRGTLSARNQISPGLPVRGPPRGADRATAARTRAHPAPVKGATGENRGLSRQARLQFGICLANVSRTKQRTNKLLAARR